MIYINSSDFGVVGLVNDIFFAIVKMNEIKDSKMKKI